MHAAIVIHKVKRISNSLVWFTIIPSHFHYNPFMVVCIITWDASNYLPWTTLCVTMWRFSFLWYQHSTKFKKEKTPTTMSHGIFLFSTVVDHLIWIRFKAAFYRHLSGEIGVITSNQQSSNCIFIFQSRRRPSFTELVQNCRVIYSTQCHYFHCFHATLQLSTSSLRGHTQGSNPNNNPP